MLIEQLVPIAVGVVVGFFTNLSNSVASNAGKNLVNWLSKKMVKNELINSIKNNPNDEEKINEFTMELLRQSNADEEFATELHKKVKEAEKSGDLVTFSNRIDSVKNLVNIDVITGGTINFN